MNRFLCVILLTSLAAACSKSADLPTTQSQLVPDGYTAYIIKKGNHYSENNDNRSIHLNKLKFKAQFDSSCIYKTVKEANMNDINKLYGFSDCNSGHHENSARFGWRWNGHGIEIHAYYYINNVRQSKFLGTVALNEPAAMSITISGNRYLFELNGKTESMPRNCTNEHADGYQLYPYFGGDEVAPHDIRILIKEITE
ncbi:MAG TPA: hypothetical protein VD993_07070 [Chitinophagaceae bacterium]|nr:hypothetical protein [Chitinophagaceae bacterium]